jgi:hypothetical protein
VAGAQDGEAPTLVARAAQGEDWSEEPGDRELPADAAFVAPRGTAAKGGRKPQVVPGGQVGRGRMAFRASLV